MSLTLVDGGAVEAHNQRLFESIHHQRDVGELGFRRYFSKYWMVYAKYRWIDHLFGIKEHPEFQRPDYFRKLAVLAPQLDEKTLQYVIRRFLGQGYPRHWDCLDFAMNRDEVHRDGFDYETEVRPIIVEFGHNLWQLSWKDFYWIKDDQLIVVKRIFAA